MNIKVILVLLALFACAVTAQREDKTIIDPFTVRTPALVLATTADPFPQSVEASTQDANILGGERDLTIVCEQGADNLVLTTGVTQGQWSVATPNSASGYALMQYDGIDGSIQLRSTGLGGVDMTAGSADGIRALIQTDIDTEYTFTVYGMNGEVSSIQQDIPGTDTTSEYILPFSSFTGNTDFTRVGAVEILIEAFDNVDTFVSVFRTTGPVVSPSATPTPGASPSPSPAGGFTWYTFDDDDNGRSPCGDEPDRRTYWVSDDNIIYYYFYGFDRPQVLAESANSGAIVSMSALVAGIVAFFAL